MHLLEGVEPIVDQHLRAMQWYAHRVTVKRRKCVIVMELQSRYALVFCGLTQRDFEQFPETFRTRLICEVASICQLGDDAQKELTPLVVAQAEQQVFQTGSDSDIQVHIQNVAWSLNEWADEHGQLPTGDGECFDFDVFINQQLRTRREDEPPFEPMERFRRFWSTMSGLMKLGEGRRRLATERSVPNNVLPFNAASKD